MIKIDNNAKLLYDKKDLIEIFGEKKCYFVSKNKKFTITNVHFDSREIKENGLFIALKGDNLDGHTFIQSAISNGAVCCIVEKIPNKITNCNFILVKNSIKAIEAIAKFNRKRLKAKVIGITGNVGKTSTREAIKASLQGIYNNIVCTEKNYNNHIGLPFTLANAKKNTEILILEMGMNHIGEINKLSKIAKPDIAIITNITSAHIGNFKDVNEIILAKSEIFNGMKKNSFVILNQKNEHYACLRQIAERRNIKNIITIGSNCSNFYIEKYSFTPDFKISYHVINCDVNSKNILYKKNVKKDISSPQNKIINCITNGVNYHNAFNTLYCFAIAKILKINYNRISENIKNIAIPKGRGNFEKIEIKLDKNSSVKRKLTIINDCYNSSPASLKDAIKTLSTIQIINNSSKCLAIIGDMLELGKFSKKFHEEIADEIIKNNILNVILVGKEGKIIFNKLMMINNYKDNIKYYSTTDKLINEIYSVIKDADFVLLKASHGLHFEKIIEKLKTNEF